MKKNVPVKIISILILAVMLAGCAAAESGPDTEHAKREEENREEQTETDAQDTQTEAAAQDAGKWSTRSPAQPSPP